jgi:hypothetical protein
VEAPVTPPSTESENAADVVAVVDATGSDTAPRAVEKLGLLLDMVEVDPAAVSEASSSSSLEDVAVTDWKGDAPNL